MPEADVEIQRGYCLVDVTVGGRELTVATAHLESTNGLSIGHPSAGTNCRECSPGVTPSSQAASTGSTTFMAGDTAAAPPSDPEIPTDDWAVYEDEERVTLYATYAEEWDTVFRAAESKAET